MNPSHTIPTMKDGDFVLTQSRAMVTYLVNIKTVIAFKMVYHIIHVNPI